MEAKNKNTAKKRPRAQNSANSANMAPTWLQKGPRRQFPGDGWPPLKACYYSTSSIKYIKTVAPTRLGTDSGAADSMCCAQTAAPEGVNEQRR